MSSNSPSLLSFWGRVEQATYRDQDLEDYAKNPLEEALPPILLGNEPTLLLGRYPARKKEDRNLPPELRYHLTKRVRQFFYPLPMVLDLRERFDSMLRSGYEGRNPLERGFWSNLDGKLETFKLNIATPQDRLYTRSCPVLATWDIRSETRRLHQSDFPFLSLPSGKRHRTAWGMENRSSSLP